MAGAIRRFRFPDKPTRCAPDFVQRLKAGEWLSQHKYDGWRLNIYNASAGVALPDGGRAVGLSLLTRVGRHFSAIDRVVIPPDIRRQAERLALPDDSVLDAEFVGPRGDHKPAVYIFDCLCWDGLWQVNTPFSQRWAVCQQLAPRFGPDIHLAETRTENFLGHFAELKNEWVAGGMGMDLCEGIVLKRLSGKLTLDLSSNKHSGDMFKLKYRDIRDERY